MPINQSGPVSIGGATTGQSINLELGRVATATSSLNEEALRTLAGVASGAISLSNFYGKSNVPPYPANVFVGSGITGSHYYQFSSNWNNNIYRINSTTNAVDSPFNGAQARGYAQSGSNTTKGIWWLGETQDDGRFGKTSEIDGVNLSTSTLYNPSITVNETNDDGGVYGYCGTSSPAGIVYAWRYRDSCVKFNMATEAKTTGPAMQLVTQYHGINTSHDGRQKGNASSWNSTNALLMHDFSFHIMNWSTESQSTKVLRPAYRYDSTYYDPGMGKHVRNTEGTTWLEKSSGAATGGPYVSANIGKINMTTMTWSDLSIKRNATVVGGSGVSTPTHGYFAGGSTNSFFNGSENRSGSGVSSAVDKFTFSSETISTSTSLPAARALLGNGISTYF
jgi:hypothetical protein